MSMRRGMLGMVAAAALAMPAAAQQRVNIGHLMDLSGATSDVGTPFSQGVNDTFGWVNGRGGVSGRQFNVLAVDYGYQAPRAVSQYQAWSRDRVVGIMGWGTADTEALVKFVTRDRIPDVSGSYAATLTDAAGKSGRPGAEATGFNFFYGPSYSDALRAMLKWSADDW
jgi:branched-chain amino acid transport system substrate-binding protein